MQGKWALALTGRVKPQPGNHQHALEFYSESEGIH